MTSDIYRQAPCWTEEIILTTHLRIAAGICVLSTGLLLVASGGAVATADHTDSTGGTTTGTAGTTSTDTTTGNLPGGDEELGTTTSPDSTEDSTDQTGPTSTVSAQTNVTSDDDEEGINSSTSDEDISGTTAPTSESTAPTAESTPTSGSNEPATPLGVTSDPTPPAPASTPAAAPPAPPATVSKVVVEPMGAAFANVARALGSSAATFAGLPASETPITDVIVSMQNMLGSVAGAGATLYQVSGDLYTLLGVSQTMPPTLIGASGAMAAPAPVTDGTAPLFGALPSQLPQGLPLNGDASLFGTVIHASTVGGVAATGLDHELSLSGLAPIAAAGGAGSFFDHVISAVLVPASLTALAAIALPGVGALLIVCGAGVRFGYRQAKAAYLMRVSGIARFAGSGPMGVVRSGSLITLHSRTDRPKAAHAAHRKPAHAVRHLERVA
jgi:hypothetical protein